MADRNTNNIPKINTLGGTIVFGTPEKPQNIIAKDISLTIDKNKKMAEYYLSLYDQISESPFYNDIAINKFVENALSQSCGHTREMTISIANLTKLCNQQPQYVRNALLSSLGISIDSLRATANKKFDNAKFPSPIEDKKLNGASLSEKASKALKKVECSYLLKKRSFFKTEREQRPGHSMYSPYECDRQIAKTEEELKKYNIIFETQNEPESL